MGARRRAEEERNRAQVIAALAQHIPGGSEQYARELYHRVEAAGRKIIGDYGPAVDGLRILLAGGIVLLVAGIAGVVAMDVRAPSFLSGMLFTIAATLILLRGVLREFPQHLGALVARNVQTTGRVSRILVIVIVFGQYAGMIYPLATWTRSLLGIEVLSPTSLAFAQGMVLGSLLGLPVTTSAALRLPRRAQATANAIWTEIRAIDLVRQCSETNKPQGV